jgi:hypothetical protein
MKFKTTDEVQRYFEMFGFKRYPDNLEKSDFMMQKCIYDTVTDDKKYFIGVYIYDFSKYGHEVMYDSKAQFYLENDTTVNITLFGKNHMNDEIHKFFEKFYNDFNCLPYEWSN